MTIRVLLVDDNEIARRGLTWIMDSSPDIEVCGEAVDGKDAGARAGELQPDVVLLDVRMPRLDGLESIGRLTAWPTAPRGRPPKRGAESPRSARVSTRCCGCSHAG
ncbi:MULTISPECIES: response regulator [unclassified Streptomyces]|uniref:response regulator transcription factor n=1 Tax=unclassified Streptomyces TaxID=2593676 RepID=UPI002E80D32F|nr:response regulator [Streptomyces sp. NBC_00562]